MYWMTKDWKWLQFQLKNANAWYSIRFQHTFYCNVLYSIQYIHCMEWRRRSNFSAAGRHFEIINCVWVIINGLFSHQSLQLETWCLPSVKYNKTDVPNFPMLLLVYRHNGTNRWKMLPPFDLDFLDFFPIKPHKFGICGCVQQKHRSTRKIGTIWAKFEKLLPKNLNLEIDFHIWKSVHLQQFGWIFDLIPASLLL